MANQIVKSTPVTAAVDVSTTSRTDVQEKRLIITVKPETARWLEIEAAKDNLSTGQAVDRLVGLVDSANKVVAAHLKKRRRQRSVKG